MTTKIKTSERKLNLEQLNDLMRTLQNVYGEVDIGNKLQTLTVYCKTEKGREPIFQINLRRTYDNHANNQWIYREGCIDTRLINARICHILGNIIIE